MNFSGLTTIRVDRRFWIAAGLTVLALVLRLRNLSNPVWVDEAVFWYRVNHGTLQEFVPVSLVRFLGLAGESIRWPFILSGAATVPAVYYLFKDKWLAFTIALIVAVHPLFTFWSGLARPYVMTGFLSVLTWYDRRWIAPALLANPHAIFAMRWPRQKIWIAGVVLFVWVLLKIRVDDAGICLNLGFLLNAKRFWYLPALGGLVYLGRLFDGVLEGRGLRTILGLARR